MLVLHAAWLVDQERFALWAEDDELPREAPPRRGRPSAKARPSPHPFASEVQPVVEVLEEVGGERARDQALKAESIALTLELPDTGRGPQPSPWIGQADAAPDAEQGLRPYTAPALGFDPVSASELLLALRAFPDDPDRCVLAGDLRFAIRALELVTELITRGRVLPTLERGQGGWRARWRPRISGPERTRIETFIEALPASFLVADALGARADGVAAVPVSRDEALRSFAWEFTDALVRSYLLESTPLTVPERRNRGPAGVSQAARHWLSALSTDDAVVESGDTDNELVALEKALGEWWASESVEASSVRTCFRLVPPEEPTDDPKARPENDPWHIEFSLQAVDDPSLMVQAEDVWADGPELVALERHVAHPDEELLRGLGRAARLVPGLGRALASATPVELPTDAEGALAFLRQDAPVLEEAGFGVFAPPWWRSSRARIGLRMRARPSPKRSSGGVLGAGLGLDGLCDVRWEVALGDERLELKELRSLARLKQPLVRVRGQWVELHQQDIEAAIETLSRRGRNQMPAGEVLRAALGLTQSSELAEIEPRHGGLVISSVEADGWLGELLRDAEDRRLAAMSTPDGFGGTLRPYQERGLGWLWFLSSLGLGACLADDMGLGKTAELLALLVAEREAYVGAAAPGVRIRKPTAASSRSRPASSRRSTTKGAAGGTGALLPTLVVCPMSLVGNWQREASRFAPDLRVYVHHGAGRLSGKDFAGEVRRVDLVLTTYGVCARDEEQLVAIEWGRVVLDEAQQIKNSAARVTRSARALKARHRVAMTGTPVENRLGELWSIMHFLNPGMLGSEQRFRQGFAIPIERHGDEEAAERLRKVTGPFVLRRLKTDHSIIADLPEKFEMKVFCNLTREQASLYQAVTDDMLERIERSEGMERRGLVLSTMLKLKQVCNHPAHFLADGSSLPGRSGKLSRLSELLEEAVAEGDRALVFTQFTEMGAMLQRHLRHHLGCEVAYLHGSVPKKKRDEIVEHFQSPSGPPVFLLSLKAGGTGLNLTAANQVVHFDRWWNPAVEDQATDRAFRIGQGRNVQVRKFVCAGTLEERIDEMIEAKRALAERIVGSGEGWITELSTEQLRELVALSADAVGE
jgi:SNF2 family DNA or RNA helicase